MSIKIASKKLLSLLLILAMVVTVIGIMPCRIKAEAMGGSGTNGNAIGNAGSYGSSDAKGWNGVVDIQAVRIYPVILDSDEKYTDTETFCTKRRDKYSAYSLVMEWGVRGGLTDDCKNMAIMTWNTFPKIHGNYTSNGDKPKFITYDNSYTKDAKGKYNNALYNVFKGLIGKDMRSTNVAELVNVAYNKADKQKVYEAWRGYMGHIYGGKDDYWNNLFGKAAETDRFALVIEPCGYFQAGTNGAYFLMPIRYIPTLSWYEARNDGLFSSDNNPTAFKEFTAARQVYNKKGGSWGGLKYTWGANVFCSSLSDTVNTNASRMLTSFIPKANDNYINGGTTINKERVSEYTGWGLLTFNADDGIVDEGKYYQIRHVRTLIGGKGERTDVGMHVASPNSEHDYYADGTYGNIGQVYSAVQGISGVWASNKATRYTKEIPKDLEANTPIDDTTYSFIGATYQVITSGGANITGDENDIKGTRALVFWSAEADCWKYEYFEVDGEGKCTGDVAYGPAKLSDENKKKYKRALDVSHDKESDNYTFKLNMEALEGYVGAKLNNLEYGTNRDIFLDINWLYDGGVLGSEYFNTIYIPQNKITYGLNSLTSYINANKASYTNKVDGETEIIRRFKSNKKGTVGALYNLVSDADITPLGNVVKALQMNDIGGVHTEDLSKGHFKTVFIKSYKFSNLSNTVKEVATEGSWGINRKKAKSIISTYARGGTDSDTFTSSSKKGRKIRVWKDFATLLTRTQKDKLKLPKYTKLQDNDAVSIANLKTSNKPAERVANKETITGENEFVRTTAASNEIKGYTYTGKSASNKVTNTNHTWRRAPVDTMIQAKALVYTPKDTTPLTIKPTGLSGDTSYVSTSDKKINFYPEVKMESDTLTSKGITSTGVYVVGDKKRSINVPVYNELEVDYGKSNVDSTTVAIDSRAKALASALGAAKTPVYLAGGIINGNITDLKVKVHSYTLDLDDNASVKSSWDMTSYNPKSAVVDSIEAGIDKIGVSNISLDIKNRVGKVIKTVTIGDGSEGIPVPNVKDEDIKDLYKAYYVVVKNNGGALDIKLYKSNTISSTNRVESTLEQKLIESLKLKEVFGSALESNEGTKKWYNESTSVFVIKEFETVLKVNGLAFTDKIPLNAGPATATTKNAQFNNGYLAYLKSKAYVKLKTEPAISIKSEWENKKPSFIIPNVTVLDISQ